jgi:hypothetical protein
MSMPATDSSLNQAEPGALAKRLTKRTAVVPPALSPRQPMSFSQSVMNLALAGVSCAAAQSCVQPCETAMVRQQLRGQTAVAGQATSFVGTLRQVP